MTINQWQMILLTCLAVFLLLLILKLKHVIKDLEQQNKNLELLKELTSHLQSCRNLNEALKLSKHYIKIILQETSGVIYLKLNQSRRLMKQTFHWGTPISRHAYLKPDACLALIRHRPFYRSSSKQYECKHIKSHHKPPNYICLPLLARNELIGLLYIEYKTHDQQFLSLAEIVSEQVALSIYNIQLREHLKLQSIQDNLTGLYNRRFFEEYAKKEIAKCSRHPTTFAILLIDIDLFKTINDTYGHLMGDKVLKEVAHKLRENCRQSDVVARWGGEEFIIYLRDISKEYAIVRAEALRRAIAKLDIVFHHVRLNTPITISIGVSLFPIHADEIDKLTSKADEALYLAKNQGRNNIMVAS